jgi:hypothetical protein
MTIISRKTRSTLPGINRKTGLKNKISQLTEKKEDPKVYLYTE